MLRPPKKNQASLEKRLSLGQAQEMRKMNLEHCVTPESKVGSQVVSEDPGYNPKRPPVGQQGHGKEQGY